MTVVERRGYRLADTIERILGEDHFDTIRSYSWSDLTRKAIGEERYVRARDSLRSKLSDSHYNTVRDLAHETPYDFCVDGLALNVTSLPFVLTDRIAHTTWRAAWVTRLTAFAPNFVTGRLFGGYQDRMHAWFDKRFHISDDPRPVRKFFKKWGVGAGVFATGQSWLYAVYLSAASLLAGEQPDPQSIAEGVGTLTVVAPLVGPWFDKGYQFVRVQFGLPPVPAYRARIQQRHGEELQ